jgi:hypothetical protein
MTNNKRLVRETHHNVFILLALNVWLRWIRCVYFCFLDQTEVKKNEAKNKPDHTEFVGKHLFVSVLRLKGKTKNT